jgi:translation initiation factor 1
MSRPNKNKISTDAAPGSGMFNPFGGLESAGLPTGAAESAPAAAAKPEKPAKLGRVILRKETAHRGGKSVIVVDGFDAKLGDDFIEALSKKLRNACGCGGTVRERAIELQGDQPAKIRALLETEGFRVGGIS